MRRRQRRLRQWLRHERLSVAMALAECQHHAAPRGQSMARARRWEGAALHGHVPDDPTPQAAGTQYFSLDVVDEVLAPRPPPLVEVRPQLGVQRHTAEQVIETFVPVQVLDAPVPQLGEAQVVEFMQKFDAPVVAEPVIKVPKISLKKARRRMGDYLRPPQTAEQLVEVQTIASFSSLLRAAEQFVDIPVPHVRGGWCGEESLQGFSPGLGSTAYCGADLDIPVPGRVGGGGHGGLQGFHPGQSTAASSEQLVDIPVPHGGPHLQDPGVASLPHEVAGEAFQGVLSTFPRPKKVRSWVRTRGRN